MKPHKFRSLSDEELKEIAKQKNKKGNATSEAKKAQEILWQRSDYAFGNRLCRDPYGSKCFASADQMTGWKD